MRETPSCLPKPWPWFALMAGILGFACSGKASEEAASTQVPEAKPQGGGLYLEDKDFILVTVDTLRADRLPFYGGKRDTAGEAQEPWTLAWMAERGTVMEQVFAQVGITLPSLASMWTGEHPLVHGALTNQSRLQMPTFAMGLRQHGWTGVGAVANGILRRGSGLDRGFRDFVAFPEPAEGEMPQYLLEKARDLVQGKQRLFLWAHFMTPHQPYIPPPALAARYTQADGPAGDNKTLFALHANPSTLTPEIEAHLKGLYDAEVLAANAHVRTLLAGLDAQYREAGRGGLLENAVVVFTSDHGEELGDRHGFFMHAKSLYGGVLQVPTIVLGEDWESRRDPRLMGLQDLLSWILKGTPPSGAPVISSLKEKFYAIRDERWTLVHNPRDDGSSPGGPPQGSLYPYPTVALYDRTVDPMEEKNVADENPEVVRRLLDTLHAWHANLPSENDAESREVDIELMNSLGYATNEEEEQGYPKPWTGDRWRASD